MPAMSGSSSKVTITSLHDGERAVPPAELEKAGLTYEGFSPTPTTWDPSAEVPICGISHVFCAGSLSAYSHWHARYSNAYFGSADQYVLPLFGRLRTNR